MRNVIEVTPNQLGDVLAQIERAVPVTIVAKTIVRMNKTVNGDRSVRNPYHDRVYKVQESNVFVAMDYETAVNKRLIKEGKDADFEASARVWGEKIGQSPVIANEKNGVTTHYLQVYFATRNKPKVSYEVLEEDGSFRPSEKEEFENYLKPSRPYTGQGLDQELAVRTFKLSNIQEVRANGNVYRVVM